MYLQSCVCLNAVLILFFSVLPLYDCKEKGERKLISNKRLTEWLLFCLGHVVFAYLPGVVPHSSPRPSCSVARYTMKGLGWPIKGPIELRPRAGQRATVWTVEI